MPITGSTTATTRATPTAAEEVDDLQVRYRRVRAFTEELAEPLSMTVEFAADQELRTEISAKFTPKRVCSELAAAGLAATRRWTNPAGDYLLTLARPA
jgi:L-histidine Nalpha-methyltransferase